MSPLFWKNVEIATDTSYFHSCNNSNFNHLNPLETYILVVAALNFRSDYRLRTHQWIERGNFDFSDPFRSIYKCHNTLFHVLVTLLIFHYYYHE